jgi:hypothetical protein
MLKRIPKSDISIRPFKAYKQWDFNQASSEIALLEAEEGNYTSNDLTTDGGLSINKHSLYGQLRAQFYNGHEDNPFVRYGDKSSDYNIQESTRDRYLSGSAKVISIPQIYVGEGIKKGSVVLIDKNGLSTTFIDDKFGNIIGAAGDSITFGKIDANDDTWNFKDISDAPYSGSFQFMPIDLNSGKFDVVYDGTPYPLKVVSFNMNTGVMIVENISFLQGAAGSDKIGNIFYTQGLVVLTRNAASLLNTNWELSFKSTKTIYEHEYLLIANEDEFNISQNPSAVVEIGKETEFTSGSDGKIYKTTTTPGVKYIKKLLTFEDGSTLDYRYSGSIGNTKAGFEHYDISGSVDSTGSFLAPFITTIGLYDDNCDLVAIAKLPQPIKSMPDLTVNFIVRFDT